MVSEAFREFRKKTAKLAAEHAAKRTGLSLKRLRDRARLYIRNHIWDLGTDEHGNLRIAWSDPRRKIFYAIRADEAFTETAARRIAGIIVKGRF